MPNPPEIQPAGDKVFYPATITYQHAAARAVQPLLPSQAGQRFFAFAALASICGVQVSEYLRKPLHRTGGFKQNLLFRERNVQVANHLIGKNRRVIDHRDRTRNSGRDRIAMRVNIEGGKYRMQ